MYYLIYVSSAAFPMSSDDLLFLLEQSREKNRRLGVTGMLVYMGGSFMQMLEGDKQVVLELFETIKHDSRHKGVIQVMAGDKHRNFEDWSMGFSNMDEVGNFPSLDEYLDENLGLRTFQEDARHARKFMISFYRTDQSSQLGR